MFFCVNAIPQRPGGGGGGEGVEGVLLVLQLACDSRNTAHYY